MRIATFEHRNMVLPGLVEGDVVLPIPSEIAPDVDSLINSWETARPRLESLSRQGAVPLAEVGLRAPIGKPGKILAIGLNYADHVRESGRELPTDQIWFAKLPNTVNGPFAKVELPAASRAIDYEVELVAVIGRSGRNIAVADALNHVFGFCVGNDVSARDWQRMTPQWTLGKSFDTHAPFGPWITTADEAVGHAALDIRCWVNGELRQSSNTGHLIFPLAEQIAHLSKAMTLNPGDLIFTGTPGGVGIAMDPPRYLASGDIVRCEIETLGMIENIFEESIADGGQGH